MNLEEKISELEKKQEELKTEIEILKEEVKEKNNGVWKPKDGDDYYYISEDGETIYNYKGRHCDVVCKIKIGNMFETREKAEFMVERLKVIAELKQFTTPYQGREKSWFIALDEDTNKLGAYYNYCRIGLVLYFESKEKVKEAIETVGEDRVKKYYLQVQED